MTDELKPCPFCGNPFEITNAESGNRKEYFIVKHEYDNCPLLMDGENGEVWLDKSRLVEMLNTRPIEDALRAELAANLNKYNAEVDQFNDGYDAGEKGGLDPFADQPDYDPDYDSWRNGYQAGSYDRLTAELAALKERTRWIPVGEWLPGDGESVIVLNFIKGAYDIFESQPNAVKVGVNDVKYTIPAYLSNGVWLLESGVPANGIIISWMPLPQPPEDSHD